MSVPPNGLPVPFLTRSWLVIPAMEEAALAAGLRSGADVVCFDLASLAAADRPEAATRLVLFLKEQREAAGGDAESACFFLLPPPDDETDALLEILMTARPEGLAVECVSPAELQELDVLVAVHEALAGVPDGQTRILATLAHAVGADFAGYSKRLIGLGWSATLFRLLLGASRMHDEEGRMTDAFQQARASVLTAAAIAAVEAVDTTSGLFSSERLQRDSREAAADGFTGKFALSPRQVPAINHAFSPDAEQLAEAEAVLSGRIDGGELARLRAMRTIRRGLPPVNR